MKDLHVIVEEAIKGDRHALESLIDEFWGMAVNYAWSFTGDYHLSQDLAQEAFIQVFRSISALQNPHAFPLWFKTILRFTCIRHMRKPTPVLADYDSLPEGRADDHSEDQCPAATLMWKETVQHVWEVINRLPEEDRSILVLYHFEDMSYKEISGFLGITTTRVTNRLHALKGKLKKELKELIDMDEGLGAGRNEKCKRNILKGVKQIGYAPADSPPMLTQFCGSLLATLAAAGGPPEIDYVSIAAASGAAFRMMWKEGWHPDNVDILAARDDPFEPMKRAFGYCGCSYDIYCCTGDYEWNRSVSAGVKRSNEKTARKNIIKSIDAGIPVIALGVIGPPECCVITGYEEEGGVVTGYNYFQYHVKDDDLTVTSDGIFHKRNWYRNMPAYIIIKEIKPVSRPKEAFYKEILEYAVDLARRSEVHGRFSGLAAYSAMARQLLHDDEYEVLSGGDGNLAFSEKQQTDFSTDVTGRFGMFCDPFLMICERKNAAAFMRRITESMPECSRMLDVAAEYYDRIATDPNVLWSRLGLFENAQERFRDPDVRSILAAQILRIQMLEEKAVVCLEEAIPLMPSYDNNL